MRRIRHISDSSTPSRQLTALMTGLRSHCSAPFWPLDVLLGYPKSSCAPVLSWMLSPLLAAWHLPTPWAYSSLLGAPVTRPAPGCSPPSLLLSAFLGLLGALLVTWRFPFCSCPLPTRCPFGSTPSCSLLTLLAAQQHPSGWHVVYTMIHTSLLATFLAARRYPGHWLPPWPLCVFMAARHCAGHSADLLLTGQCRSSHPTPSRYSLPLGLSRTGEHRCLS